MLQVQSYTGYDVSEMALQICKEKFLNAPDKVFRHYDGSIVDDIGFYDMAISLDVIYHLVEDEIFGNYLCNLFNSSNKYVCIYSSNYEARQSTEYIRRRKFTKHVECLFPNWSLMSVVENPYLYDGSAKNEMSNSNFYFYEKRM